MDIEKIQNGMKVIPISNPANSVSWRGQNGSYLYARQIFVNESYTPSYIIAFGLPIIECGQYPVKWGGIGYFKPSDLVPYSDKNERDFYGKGILGEKNGASPNPNW